jgi:hypothetical protein
MGFCIKHCKTNEVDKFKQRQEMLVTTLSVWLENLEITVQKLIVEAETKNFYIFTVLYIFLINGRNLMKQCFTQKNDKNLIFMFEILHARACDSFVS